MIGLAKNKHTIELKDNGKVSGIIGTSNFLLGHVMALNNLNLLIAIWKV